MSSPPASSRAEPHIVASKTISIYGNDADVFGYAGDDYFERAQLNAANNEMLFATLEALPHQSVIIDAGANIGLTTILAARVSKAVRRILAIEPSPRARACLERTVAANRLSDIVTIIPVGLSDRVGSVAFCEEDYLAASHLEFDHAGVAQRPPIPFRVASRLKRMLGLPNRTDSYAPVTTLDALARQIQLDRLDLIKLDIEGSELEALKGATETIRRFNPRFVMEFFSVAICAVRRTSPIFLLEFILDRFGSFSFLDDGKVITVSTHAEAVEFMVRNMVRAKINVDDIAFGGREAP